MTCIVFLASTAHSNRRSNSLALSENMNGLSLYSACSICFLVSDHSIDAWLILLLLSRATNLLIIDLASRLLLANDFIGLKLSRLIFLHTSLAHTHTCLKRANLPKQPSCLKRSTTVQIPSWPPIRTHCTLADAATATTDKH